MHSVFPSLGQVMQAPILCRGCALCSPCGLRILPSPRAHVYVLSGISTTLAFTAKYPDLVTNSSFGLVRAGWARLHATAAGCCLLLRRCCCLMLVWAVKCRRCSLHQCACFALQFASVVPPDEGDHQRRCRQFGPRAHGRSCPWPPGRRPALDEDRFVPPPALLSPISN